MIEASANPATSAPPVTSLTKTLGDLDRFTPILDHCCAAYGRSYRAALERLRIAIEGTEAGA